ncbi:hypothetical protein [Pseudodesulfovibrio sp.]|uniref:hypothetical protein n=1 Tax=unclassified Pseudodesulfovibrio TaxID=2661612 RepID=UPI003B00D2EB
MISCSTCTPTHQVSAALKAAIKQSVRPSEFTVVADMQICFGKIFNLYCYILLFTVYLLFILYLQYLHLEEKREGNSLKYKTLFSWNDVCVSTKPKRGKLLDITEKYPQSVFCRDMQVLRIHPSFGGCEVGK